MVLLLLAIVLVTVVGLLMLKVQKRAKNNLNVFNTTLKNNNAPNAGTIYTGGDLSLVKSNVLYDTAEDDKAIVCKGYITFSI